MPIDDIHQSMLSTGLMCGERLRRRYIVGDVVPPSIPAGRGTAVHKASDVNLKHKLEKGDSLPLGDLLDVTRDGYVEAFEYGNQVHLPKEDWPQRKTLLNNGLNDALRCTELYLDEVAPGIVPVAVEESFLIKVEGVKRPLAGRMDYQEGNIVGDLKTSGMKWQDGRIMQEIQPVFYTFIHEYTRGVRPEFVYNILIARRNKEGKETSTSLQVQSMTPTDEQYSALFAKISAFERLLDAEIYPPANPSAWWCTEKWCGYWTTCPYVGNAAPINWF